MSKQTKQINYHPWVMILLKISPIYEKNKGENFYGLKYIGLALFWLISNYQKVSSRSAHSQCISI